MDAVFFLIAIVASILGLMGMAATATSDEWEMFKVAGGVFLAGVILFIWLGCATSNHEPTSKVTLHEIVDLRGVPFYFNDEDKPIEITSDARFADPKQTVVRITVVPGGWKYGMYVTERRKVEFTKKPSVEK